MKLRRAAWIALALAGSSLGAPEVTWAQVASASAQALFDEGVKLMDQGGYREALVKLEESYRQDPATGTKYRLAVCYEMTGRFASAWAAWKEVADAFGRVHDTEKASAAQGRADSLVSKLAYLRVTATPEAAGTPGLVIRRDDVEIGRGALDTRIPVDPGEHRISASAPNKKPWSMTVTAEAGGAPLDVHIPALVDVPAPPSPSQPLPAPPSAGLSGQRIGAIVAGSIGLLGLGFGSGFGGAAIAKWNDVKSGGHCQKDERGNLLPHTCDDLAIGMGNAAGTLATASDIAFLVGGAGVVAAGILWLTAGPRTKAAPVSWIVPFASPHGVGVGAAARF